jgi:crotonobetainyl-CoA:carnitine CoA-transferase CaiB-like acyl-CoA transferase
LRVVNLAVYLPGPLAAARLQALGAAVVTVEWPAGSPLAAACPAWYDALHTGVEVVRLDLKAPAARARLDALLAGSDLLLTATRPAALARLGLDWPALHDRFPQLSQVAMVGYPGDADRPGHDLNYQAELGLLAPPALPRILLADYAGAEQAVSLALALLLARARGQESHYAEVSLAAAAAPYADPLRYGVTAPGGLLGGGLPGYGLYPTREGWLAVSALEPVFQERLVRALGVPAATREALAAAFLARTADEWATWGREHDLPLAAVREIAAAPPRINAGDFHG